MANNYILNDVKIRVKELGSLGLPVGVMKMTMELEEVQYLLELIQELGNVASVYYLEAHDQDYPSEHFINIAENNILVKNL